MKKLFVIAAALFASSVFAQAVELVRTEDGDVWYGYPTTLRADMSRISLQVGLKQGSREESLMFVSVLKDSCTTRRGALYTKQKQESAWHKVADIDLGSATVADQLALVMCATYNQEKSKKSRLTV